MIRALADLSDEPRVHDRRSLHHDMIDSAWGLLGRRDARRGLSFEVREREPVTEQRLEDVPLGVEVAEEGGVIVASRQRGQASELVRRARSGAHVRVDDGPLRHSEREEALAGIARERLALEERRVAVGERHEVLCGIGKGRARIDYAQLGQARVGVVEDRGARPELRRLALADPTAVPNPRNSIRPPS